MSRPQELQQQFNRETRDAGDWYAGHRQRLTRLLLDASGGALAPDPRSAAILGVGNANDLELATLATAFDRLVLVDRDVEAVAAATVRHRHLGARLEWRSGVDVTGGEELLSEWRPDQPATGQQISAWRQRLEDFFLDLPRESFALAASTCLLSQLILALAETLGGEHPSFLECLQTLRRQHLRILWRLVRPGGAVVLVTDWVSSDTAPDLLGLTADDPRLPGFAQAQLAAGNFFTGLHPGDMLPTITGDAEIGATLAQARISSPWLWRISPQRAYLVYSAVLRKRPSLEATHEGGNS